MREACIILPDTTIEAWPHYDLGRALIACFGGVTITNGQGAWANPAYTNDTVFETMRIYTVAGEDTKENNATIRKLALRAKIDAKQTAIYFRLFNGKVEIN